MLSEMSYGENCHAILEASTVMGYLLFSLFIYTLQLLMIVIRKLPKGGFKLILFYILLSP